MSPPDASLAVVIVTYNSENEITGCLDALARAATSFRTRVCVVDNASADATVSTVRDWARRRSSERFVVEVVPQPRNLGFTRGMNVGLERVRGDYLLWLNPDVQLEPDALRILRRTVDEPGVGVAAPQLLNPDGSVQPSCRRFPRHRDLWFESFGLSRLFPRSRLFAGWKMGDFDHKSRRAVDQPQGACLFYRGEVAEQLGKLDERFGMFFSDVDACRRVHERGLKIVFEPAAKAVHAKGASVYRFREYSLLHSHRDFSRYFWKWYPGLRWFPANTLVSLLLFELLPVRLLGLKISRLIRRGR